MLKFRVYALKFEAGVGCGELPMNRSPRRVTVMYPDRYFVFHHFKRGYPAGKALLMPAGFNFVFLSVVPMAVAEMLSNTPSSTIRPAKSRI
jgi:hypothetical protein